MDKVSKKTNIKDLAFADQIAGTDLVLVSVNGKARRALASLLKGQKGDDVELRINETHIQWRLKGGEWTDLISFAELRGPIEEAADLANQAAEAATEASIAAESATESANIATGTANDAAKLANAAASAATIATRDANSATESANNATINANTAAEGAITAKLAADTATDLANTAAETALDATYKTNQATVAANDAAASANTAADNANAAAGTVTNKLSVDGDGKDLTVTFSEARERINIVSGEKLSVLWGKAWKWFTDLKAVAFSGKASDLTDDENHRLVTDAEKTGWDDKYTKNQTDTKDAAGLKAAKDYTDSLSDNVYKKSETYVRTEIDDKDAATLRSAKDYTDTLSGNVYKKTDTYNRTDIDNRDAAALQAAKNYAAQKVAEVVNSAPGTLDTLQELAAALGNNPNFATSIMALLGGKADTVHKHTKSQITDFPASMPASDVYAWAKAANKPSYTPAEVGAAAASHTHPASQVTEETNKRFMTDTERSKLSGIAAGANAYTHPASHPATMITEDSAHRFVTDSEKSNWNGKESAFAKNTAFNKNFGSGAGTVCQGNDSRLSDARTPVAHSHPASQITEDANHRYVTDTEKAKWNRQTSGVLRRIGSWIATEIGGPTVNFSTIYIVGGISLSCSRISGGKYKITHNIPGRIEINAFGTSLSPVEELKVKYESVDKNNFILSVTKTSRITITFTINAFEL